MTDTEKPTAKNTKNEGQFWLAVFECCESPPKIDFDKLAEKCNYKNATTARVMFNGKRKALRDAELALNGGTGAAAPPVSPKRAVSRSRKRTARMGGRRRTGKEEGQRQTEEGGGSTGGGGGADYYCGGGC
ncbi:uncharacterized protein LAJ45_08678 [Morchella importuna]|uniref:uncharacterized protein n=1 Tax=Morchella importuna TaxID=1174673 RepID=UPI001E8DEC43|nr:uncharacterized protein LAJ45_08678 [Morchella importuna]KAH8147200.1 hypothetical protein LAJ45_08678 [Morchella importuna]